MKEIVCRETARGEFEPVPTRAAKRKEAQAKAARDERWQAVLMVVYFVICGAVIISANVATLWLPR